jgi:hypothetical protein
MIHYPAIAALDALSLERRPAHRWLLGRRRAAERCRGFELESVLMRVSPQTLEAIQKRSLTNWLVQFAFGTTVPAEEAGRGG